MINQRLQPFNFASPALSKQNCDDRKCHSRATTWISRRWTAGHVAGAFISRVSPGNILASSHIISYPILSTMGTSLSAQSQARVNSTEPKIGSLPETAPPDILFTSPYFLPKPTDVLVIESYFSMAGARLGYALLYSPHIDAGGMIVDTSGRVCNVPEERWEEMETVVRQAKKVSQELRQSSWSCPQTGSCPTSVYFDLGPADNPDQLYALYRTGHRVSTEDLPLTGTSKTLPVMKHPEIRTWTKSVNGKYEETTLKKMPEPIAALEAALAQLHQELLPRSTDALIPEGDDAKAMAAAIKNLCGAIRGERQRYQDFKRTFDRSQRRWFNWW
ncbi:hypothetical protein B0H19DRAFT_1253451 [Mycena capillaripes]|nr:hypothetical protein B0H19DRAFT_1253451 [Mycena capillaripes]